MAHPLENQAFTSDPVDPEDRIKDVNDRTKGTALRVTYTDEDNARLDPNYEAATSGKETYNG